MKAANPPRARRVWVALALLAACVAPVACGQPASPAPTAAGPTPTITVPIEMPVVISVSGAIDEQMLGVLDAQIAAFEAENPDVFVEVVDPVGDGESTLEEVTSFLSQGDPSCDIYVVSATWLADLAGKGWLTPLDGYVERAGMDLARLFPAALDAVVYNGSVMGLPWLADGKVLVLSAGSDRPDEAFRLMAFLVEADPQP